MDCFIQPSYKEGISIALLEALRTELPTIVGNTTTSHPVITPNHNGLIVTPNKSFIPALCNLIENQEQCTLLADNGKKIVTEKFSHSVMAHNYIKLFKKYAQ